MTALDPNPEAEAPDADVVETPAPAPAEVPAGQEDDDSTALGGKPEEKPAEEAKPTAPEKYELKAPEGMEFDTAAFEAAEPVLRELGLSNEQAQKLADAYGQKIAPQIMERAQGAIAARAAEQRKTWNDAFEADPDLGGTKKDETLGFAAKAFDHFGLKKGEGLRQLLDESGLGNHPDMIRFVSGVGRALGEAAFDRGGAEATPLTDAERFYGKGYGKQQAEQRS